MIHRRTGRHRRGPGLLLLPLLLLAFAAAPRPAGAQVRDTTRADTLAVDTLQARADSLAALTDTIPPPPVLVPLAYPRVESFGGAVWHWGREALLNEAAISLADLLDRIPGIATFRTGLYLQPEAASALGGTAGRLEIDYDGYILDPLSSATFDLSRLGLIELDDVTVERRLNLLRIRIRTAQSTNSRPYSRVEAGLGQPVANMFRGIFLAPHVIIGPLGLAIDRIDTDGIGRDEPANDFIGWAKWGVTRENWGVQGEVRRASLDREEGGPWPISLHRTDLMLRARTRVPGGVVAELFAGRSSLSGEPPDTTTVPGDTLPPPKIDNSTTQLGARASWEHRFGWLEGALRTRSADALPSIQADLSGGIHLSDFVRLEGAFTSTSWRDAPRRSSVDAIVRLGPVRGIQLFAEWANGTRAGPFWRDSLPADSVLSRADDRSAIRIGGEAELFGIRVGGAFQRIQSDSVPPFGLPFDSTVARFAGGDLRGFEVYGRVPLFGNWLAADGSYSNWFQGQVWPYTPQRTWRAGVDLHAIPFASGNLEIIARLEGHFRSEVLAPEPFTEGQPLAVVPARTLLDAYLQIRIVDVRIFGRFEDMAGTGTEDIPGRIIPGPRLFYGVKWSFWN